MRKYIAVLILLSLTFQAFAQNEKAETWLVDNSFALSSISPVDENFKDLQFLKPILKDKKIILLGEEDHTFASTFEAKSRLIKFLNKEMGFRVLAFEFNLYTAWKAGQETHNENEKFTPIQKILYPFWGRTVATQELFRYIEETRNTKDQIKFIGFDNQVAREFSLVEELDKLLLERNSEIRDYKGFKLFIESLDKNYRMGLLQVSEKDFVLINMFIDDILNEFELKGIRSEKEKIISRSLINVKTNIYNNLVDEPTRPYLFGNLDPKPGKYGFIGDKRSMGSYNRRDKDMAENIRWITEKLFPNEKVIIWAATAHTMYNRDKAKFTYPETFQFHTRFTYGYNFQNTGSYLQKYYGEQLYNIGFTTVSGTVDYSRNSQAQNLTKIVSQKGSFESMLKKIDSKYTFFDFSTNKKTLPKRIFNDKMISNSVGGSTTIGDISKFFDGILAIKDAQPIKYIK